MPHKPTEEQTAIIHWQGRKLVVNACRYRENQHTGQLCHGLPGKQDALSRL